MGTEEGCDASEKGYKQLHKVQISEKNCKLKSEDWILAYYTHHSVLWVDRREGAWLSDVRRVAKHGRVARR